VRDRGVDHGQQEALSLDLVVLYLDGEIYDLDQVIRLIFLPRAQRLDLDLHELKFLASVADFDFKNLVFDIRSV